MKGFQVRALSAEFGDEVPTASSSHTLPLLKFPFTSFMAAHAVDHHTAISQLLI